jgi:tryptophan-rich sensory protein
VRIPVASSTSYRGRNERPNLLLLAAFVISALGAGVLTYLLGPATSPEAAHWYGSLIKPAWMPPSRWFAPLWATLYGLMALGAWLIFRERYHRARGIALFAYWLQLLLNAAWAPVFFVTRSIGAGLFVTLALLFAVAWTVREFGRVRASAALLMLPYFAWLCVVVAMNYEIWALNP